MRALRRVLVGAVAAGCVAGVLGVSQARAATPDRPCMNCPSVLDAVKWNMKNGGIVENPDGVTAEELEGTDPGLIDIQVGVNDEGLGRGRIIITLPGRHPVIWEGDIWELLGWVEPPPASYPVPDNYEETATHENGESAGCGGDNT